MTAQPNKGKKKVMTMDFVKMLATDLVEELADAIEDNPADKAEIDKVVEGIILFVGHLDYSINGSPRDEMTMAQIVIHGGALLNPEDLARYDDNGSKV